MDDGAGRGLVYHVGMVMERGGGVYHVGMVVLLG